MEGDVVIRDTDGWCKLKSSDGVVLIVNVGSSNEILDVWVVGDVGDENGMDLCP